MERNGLHEIQGQYLSLLVGAWSYMALTPREFHGNPLF